ncbi:hypothetical protein VE01_03295 [Pseudogymnoascus verrucosus]|uniref:Uncharacterized protein n=1 Tax=Pseudogymnoascus verrucosus TaxID=342668 RepID=A0A1B8GSR4_9PEZI|nr:uncharacterized protein VE01_03295 [Pseudogymnoascus verrucosus]OBT98868.1 hypothetical protein VE01_03295 [Pseudogymnoascus verrucosus]
MDITLIREPGGNITGAIFFPYTPSLPAAYVFMGSFAFLTIAHIIYMFPLRSWYFLSFILGGICETFGYYGRTKAHENISEIGSWMLQNVLILGGPTFLAATVYMTLGRYIVALDAHDHAMIAPRWITRIYILIDVLCFVSQFMGAGIQASGDPKIINIGNKAILGGLIFQLVAFAFFVLMAIRVHSRLNGRHEVYTAMPSRWPMSRKYFWGLYVVSVLFIVRNLVRAIEYAQQATSGGISYATRNTDGTITIPKKEGSGSIGSNEIFLYIFDAAPMALVALTFLLLHPGRMLKAVRSGKGERLLEMETGITMTG